MAKLIPALFFLILFLSACSSTALSSEAPPPPHVSDTPTSLPGQVATTEVPTEIIPVLTTEVLPPEKIIATLSTPHIDQGPDGSPTLPDYYSRNCGYQWAYKEMPELSSEFLLSLQALQPEAQGHAFGFGENCVYADGSATFIPMETDFNVTIPVRDTTDAAALGEWVVKVMQVIDNIPPDQIIGPRPGRVSILFDHVQRETVGFYIDQYHALPAGLSTAEIYQSLKSLQP